MHIKVAYVRGATDSFQSEVDFFFLHRFTILNGLFHFAAFGLWIHLKFIFRIWNMFSCRLVRWRIKEHFCFATTEKLFKNEQLKQKSTDLLGSFFSPHISLSGIQTDCVHLNVNFIPYWTLAESETETDTKAKKVFKLRTTLFTIWVHFMGLKLRRRSHISVFFRKLWEIVMFHSTLSSFSSVIEFLRSLEIYAQNMPEVSLNMEYTH